MADIYIAVIGLSLLSVVTSALGVALGMGFSAGIMSLLVGAGNPI